MSRIATTFKDIKSRGEKGLITFLTAGDPSLATTEKIIHALVEAGVDLIELGFPFSDPMADGPTIQASSERALAAGTTLPRILKLVENVRRHTNIPIILMGYFNPVFKYGSEKFAQDASRAGVDGLLLVDLPPEEAEELHPFLQGADIDLITLLAPTTNKARMAQLSAGGEGFLYFVSMTGVTGSQGINADAIAETVRDLRKQCVLPVAVGFGVSSASEAQSVAEFADAVVVGSALVKLIGQFGESSELIPEVVRFVRDLKAAIGANVP